MEPGCKPEGFGRPVQPAVPNRPRCRVEKGSVSGRIFGPMRGLTNLDLRIFYVLVDFYPYQVNVVKKLIFMAYDFLIVF